jgi:hypothetical protein
VKQNSKKLKRKRMVIQKSYNRNFRKKRTKKTERRKLPMK